MRDELATLNPINTHSITSPEEQTGYGNQYEQNINFVTIKLYLKPKELGKVSLVIANHE